MYPEFPKNRKPACFRFLRNAMQDLHRLEGWNNTNKPVQSLRYFIFHLTLKMLHVELEIILVQAM